MHILKTNLLLLLLLPPMAALAQTAAPPAAAAAGDDKPVVLDSMDVVDQHESPFTTANVDLPRTVNDAQPYVIFDAAAIGQSGAADVQDFLRRNLTMDATKMTGSQGISVAGAASSFDLRGLGANHTLILVNGRRVAGGNAAGNSPGGDQPDLNGIPLSAIERIEILPTSASALYGASAVGGIINVVLKRNYAGGEVKVTYQNTFESDAPIRRVDLSYGFALEGGRTQVMLTSGWSDQPALTFQDRPFLRDYELYRQGLEGGPAGVFQFTTAAPNIISNPNTQTLTLKPAFGGGSLGSNITFIPLGTTAAASPATLGAGLLANAGRQNLLMPDTVQYNGGRLTEMGTAYDAKSFLATVKRKMTANLEVTAEFAYNASRNERHLSSFQQQTVAANVPTNPFNQSVQVYIAYPFDQPTTGSNDSHRWTTGFLLKLPADWIVQGDYTWSGRRNAFALPTTSTTDINAALLAGTLNPFVDASVASYDPSRYIGSTIWSARTTLNDVSLRATGPVWTLPAGPLTAAVGLQRRQEGWADAHRELVFAAFPSRNTDTIFLGKKQVTRGAYAELQVPVVSARNALPGIQQLDFQLAARVEDYKVGTGTASVAILPVPATPPTVRSNQARYESVQPTVGLRYRPVRDLMVRASYSGGFIPPTYAQLLRNPVPSTTLTTVNDPWRGNSARSVPTLSGGNPDLEPEKAKTWKAGLVFSPAFAPGLRLSADYYRIEKEDNIGTLSAQILVDNETLFPGRITRDPVPAGDSFGVGPITLIDTSSLNLLKARNEGVDVSLSYRRKTASLGEFQFSLNNTFALHFKRQTVFGAPFVDWVNTSGSAPLKFRSAGSLVWDRDAWKFGWSANYYGRYKVLAPPVTTSTASVVRQGGLYIPSQVYHNAFASYRFNATPGAPSRRDSLTRGLELQLGIENIFNRIPPYEGNSPNGFTYSTWGSLRLREYRVALKKAF